MRKASVGMTLRVTPELHALVVAAADRDHSSLNRFMVGALWLRLGELDTAAQLPRSHIKEPFGRRKVEE